MQPSHGFQSSGEQCIHLVLIFDTSNLVLQYIRGSSIARSGCLMPSCSETSCFSSRIRDITAKCLCPHRVLLEWQPAWNRLLLPNTVFEIYFLVFTGQPTFYYIDIGFLKIN